MGGMTTDGGTDLELNSLDSKMLRLADYSSPEQISAELGGVLSPARVRIRLTELLDTTDWLSDAQQEKLNLLKMRQLLSRIENMVGADFDLDNLKLQLRALKEIGNRLDKRRAAIDVDIERYDRSVAMELVRVYDISLAYMKGALRGEIDAEKWDETAREALLHAQEEVMKKAIEA